MNREIKFRSWSKELCIIIPFEEMSAGLGKYNVTLSAYFQNTDYEIMQFTGLKDKNGKDIYEGDILREEIEGENEGEPVLEFNYFLVAYVKEYGSFCLLSKSEYEDYQENGIAIFDPTMRETYGLDEAVTLFICGNIFKTPEKLK